MVLNVVLFGCQMWMMDYEVLKLVLFEFEQCISSMEMDDWQVIWQV
jgi:hypothetical protein